MRIPQIAFVIALAILGQYRVAPVVLYSVTSKSDQGQITINARKEYNIWNNEPNRTFYEVNLYSPLIEYKFQEIRVGIEWASALGEYSERVVFYGTVGDGAFMQHRIDENQDFQGRYFVPNYEVVSIPKYHHYLSQELKSEHLLQYKLDIPENDTEIYISNGVAKINFYVDRDEPYGGNQIWLNWGVFDSSEEETTWKVYGPSESYNYDIILTWSDYFDRPLLIYLIMYISAAGMAGVLAGPISFFPIVLVMLYTTFVPFGVYMFADVTDAMTYGAYLLEVVLRFQFVTQTSAAILAFSNFLPIILLFYYIHGFYQDPSTIYTTLTNFNSEVWANFWVQAFLIYVFQLCANLAVFIVWALTLHL